MKKLVILKNGTAPIDVLPYYGDFEDHFLRSLELTRHDALVIDMVRMQPLPKLDRIAGIIVTGSLTMISTHEPWMEAEAVWLRKAVAAEIPLLAVCFGHQMLAYALGGRPDYNPHGPEIGTVRVHLTKRAGEDFLFLGMPSPMAVQAAHSQSVLTLPKDAVLLAGNEHDGHHAFRVGECAWGLQFHPEFEAGLTRMAIENDRDLLIEKGQDPASLLKTCRDTPQSMEIMRRFALLFQKEL